MKSIFLTPLIYEDLLGGRYVKLYKPFKYYSKILRGVVTIPEEFICDKESVPFLKGSCPRGGVVHDYFCCKDSTPIVTKQQAASLYLEVQAAKDKELNNQLNKNWFSKSTRFIKRNFKTLVVRTWPGYFHKHKVMDVPEDL